MGPSGPEDVPHVREARQARGQEGQVHVRARDAPDPRLPRLRPRQGLPPVLRRVRPGRSQPGGGLVHPDPRPARRLPREEDPRRPAALRLPEGRRLQQGRDLGGRDPGRPARPPADHRGDGRGRDHDLAEGRQEGRRQEGDEGELAPPTGPKGRGESPDPLGLTISTLRDSPSGPWVGVAGCGSGSISSSGSAEWV